MKQIYFLFLYFIFLSFLTQVFSRNHEIRITNDKRHSIKLNEFGYYPKGYLFLNITKFKVDDNSNFIYGFTLDKSSYRGVSYYAESTTLCMLEKDSILSKKLSAYTIQYNSLNNTFAFVQYGTGYNGVLIYYGVNSTALTDENHLATDKINFTVKGNVNTQLIKTLQTLIISFQKENALNLTMYMAKKLEEGVILSSFEKWIVSQFLSKSFREKIENKDFLSDPNIISNLKVLINLIISNSKNSEKVNELKVLYKSLQKPMVVNFKLPLSLLIMFPTEEEEGLYDLYFHNCIKRSVTSLSVKRKPVTIRIHLVEKNWNSYLSAGDQPLPLLYFIMCSAYVILSIVWSIILRTSKHAVFKIHYLMLTLLIMKALTLVFHGINYYEIGRYGVQEQGWAIMFYITHLLKGALLFTTIILIGAGWAFIKHMLSSKEKKIFMIVIPLQVLANIIAIINEESEESAVRYITWRDIFLLVDLICCGAILFPVIWSIKHLKEAANIDGKQQLNLHKLQLFRHFYILVICYIYCARIVVYLLIVTVSFKITWTIDLFREVSTMIFMIITGYKFRPVSNNPYLQVPIDEDDDDEAEQHDMEHAWSQSGITDGVVKMNRINGLDSGADLSGSGDEMENDLFDRSKERDPVDDQQKADESSLSINISNGNEKSDGLVHTSRL